MIQDRIQELELDLETCKSALELYEVGLPSFSYKISGRNYYDLMKVLEQHLKLLKDLEAGIIAIVPIEPDAKQLTRFNDPITLLYGETDQRLGYTKSTAKSVYETMIKSAPPYKWSQE